MEEEYNPVLEAKIRQRIFDSLVDMVNRIDTHIIQTHSTALREKDAKNYQDLASCLESGDGTAGYLIKCKQEFQIRMNQSLPILEKIKETKQELYKCVNKRYSEAKLDDLSKTGVDGCLYAFEKAVKVALI